MADILAALQELDDKQNAKPATGGRHSKNSSKGSSKRGVSQSSSNRKNSTTGFIPNQNVRPRPQSVPPPAQRPETPPDTPHDSDNFSLRSTSQGGDSRRVSFAEAPRPQIRRLRLYTRSDSLASGFIFDAKLHKFGVTEEEWERFSDNVVEACEVPGPQWMWPFRRKEVVARLKKELQYDGDLKRAFKRWNKDFKARGFQVWLELPSGHPSEREADTHSESKEEEKQAKREAKRFRIVLSPNSEKGGSVYSRSSSLTRSVTGEGSIASQPSVDQEIADAEREEAVAAAVEEESRRRAAVPDDEVVSTTATPLQAATSTATPAAGGT